ncbi:MAG TPA: beta-ketoacyl synthase N-terminal-like domain-containing protein [Streptosporangiaceae bacterium]|jgi:malonyl-ACP decarboxylase
MKAAAGDVVITSVAVLTSVADTPDGFAQALRDGRSGVQLAEVPEFGRVPVAVPAAPVAAPSAGPLAEPARASRLRALADRCSLPTLAAARVGWEAVLSAGLSDSELGRTAVVVGGNNLALGYQARVWAACAGGGTVLPSHAVAHLDIDTVGVISELTGVAAEGCTIGGSSASGALALIHGARLLALGAADHCLVVGALSELSAPEYRAFTDAGAMAGGPVRSPRAVCRPFDAARSGFVHGHGAGAMVLERSGTARRRGARPLAVLAGHAQRLDGRRGTEPRPERQAETITAALADAGLRAGEVDYVNAHATGSRLGDRAEAEALHQVFGRARPLVNSTKELTGHCLAAAGLIEAIATVLQLRDGFCHPNPNLAQPEDTRLAYAGRQPAVGRLRAAVSTSFAFSGINAAIAITTPEDS